MSIKNYFSFNRGEKRGTVVLQSIILGLIIFNLSSVFFKSSHQTDFSEFESAVNQFEKELSVKPKKTIKHSYSINPTIKLFAFNPNTISNEQWKKLGFKDWQIKTINHYKIKGGKWKIKSDLKKIYGLTEAQYKKLVPYILLPNEIKSGPKTTSAQSFSKNKNYTLLIDINKADTTTLKKLTGIGSGYAKRIIKYRELLGGFTKIEQLKEVYGINKETYDLIKPNLKLNDPLILKIDINKASVDELKNHPYISWNIANSIVKIRELHGKFKNVDEIKRSHLIDDDIYNKIEPYLKTE